eukprot:GEMP01028036.1.p1 GENE.GEMP01028036.1~~GEMP01028036.1.p1  ORF type:complete len:138 (+),score=40.30 GEMP01028036.1:36-416(+)
MSKRWRPWDQLTYEEKLNKEKKEGKLDERRIKGFAKGSMAPRREEKADSTALSDLFFVQKSSMLDEARLEDLIEDPELLAEMEREDKKWALQQQIKELDMEVEANEKRIERYRAQLTQFDASPLRS